MMLEMISDPILNFFFLDKMIRKLKKENNKND